jgi:hypothetical protein
MDLLELVASVSERISRSGFRVVDERVGGPMGSGRVRLSDGHCDVDLVDDRGALSIAIGRSGSDQSWSTAVWLEVLDLEMHEINDIADEVDLIVELLPVIQTELAADRDLDVRLREANWRRVKDHLGMDPDASLPTEPD